MPTKPHQNVTYKGDDFVCEEAIILVKGSDPRGVLQKEKTYNAYINVNTGKATTVGIDGKIYNAVFFIGIIYNDA